MNCLGYLSGSPRVSTRPQAQEHGPACHVLGTMDGFRSAGWRVLPYVVGDRVPLGWLGGARAPSRSGGLARMGADVFRIASNIRHGRSAYREMGGKVDWVYERFGAFQSLGAAFQRHGVPWIVETNSPQALENAMESRRRTVCFRRAAQSHERRTYRRCDALVVQTAALKEILLEFFQISPGKVFVVPNAVDLKRFVDAPPIRKFAGPTIGFVGALRRWQALEDVLRAIHGLDPEGIAYNLVVVGEGEMHPEWRELAHALGLGERVFFAGPVPWEQIPGWIAGFDLGFSGQAGSVAGRPMYFSPLKLYEYMAAAKPVLASAHEDSRRLILPGKTGYLFEPGAWPDLQRALRLAWSERASWPELGRQARATVAAGHTWETRVKDMIARIHGFLQDRGAHAGG